MSDARSNWSSKTGMILAATGSAVGLGAIWKFPYMAGANGGSAFIIPFILMVLFFGVTLILAEIIIGRAGRGSSGKRAGSMSVMYAQGNFLRAE